MDDQIDVLVANRFISNLSKSIQALCHICMDFDSGIEIVGYINVNIDSGSKVDYVLNEKMTKSNTNSMTFVSNSFLAKKDVPKQTRDGACSPVAELQPVESSADKSSYNNPQSLMQFEHLVSHRHSKKRTSPHIDNDCSSSLKRNRGDHISDTSSQQHTIDEASPQQTCQISLQNNTCYTSLQVEKSEASSQRHIKSQTWLQEQTNEVLSDQHIPTTPPPSTSITPPLEDNTPIDAFQALRNIKQEFIPSVTEDETGKLEEASTLTEQPSESSMPPDMNTKQDLKDSVICKTEVEEHVNEHTEHTYLADTGSTDNTGHNNVNPDLDGTFLGQSAECGTNETSSAQQTIGLSDSSAWPEAGDSSHTPAVDIPSGSGDYTETREELYYQDPAEGSSDAGQFEVIEIGEGEDEGDVQGMFGQVHELREDPGEGASDAAQWGVIEIEDAEESVDTQGVFGGESLPRLRPRVSTKSPKDQLPPIPPEKLNKMPVTAAKRVKKSYRKRKSEISKMYPTFLQAEKRQKKSIRRRKSEIPKANQALQLHAEIEKKQAKECPVCKKKFKPGIEYNEHVMIHYDFVPM